MLKPLHDYVILKKEKAETQTAKWNHFNKSKRTSKQSSDCCLCWA